MSTRDLLILKGMRVSGFLVFIACIIAWAFASPVSDTEAAYRILNKYLQRFGGDDLQDVYLVGDHGIVVEHEHLMSGFLMSL
ncbi:unnamed protein product [Strongylus vulgaris]|uniref:Uncharacterized protein n=1 Tax=Strongylus vulgaris TaxID=40348 RepID=A0A3P7IWW2_STRVU|nr:unnamed protein product [Strongylus vulgaris]